MSNPALDALRRNVTGRIESGDAVAIVEIPAPHVTTPADPWAIVGEFAPPTESRYRTSSRSRHGRIKP